MRRWNISILKGKILVLELCPHDVSGRLDPFIFSSNLFKIGVCGGGGELVGGENREMQ